MNQDKQNAINKATSITDAVIDAARDLARSGIQHNTWTTIKPTITEDCLLVVMNEKLHFPREFRVFEMIHDDGDIIPLQDGSEWGLWQDLTAQQYLTLKLPV